MENYGCRFKCSDKFNKDHQRQFLADYHIVNLNNSQRKNFLCQLVVETEIARIRPRADCTPETTRKNRSHSHYPLTILME